MQNQIINIKNINGNNNNKFRLSRLGWIILIIGILAALGSFSEGEPSIKKAIVLVFLILVTVVLSWGVSRIQFAKKNKNTTSINVSSMLNSITNNKLISEIVSAYYKGDDFSGIEVKLKELSENAQKNTLYSALEKIIEDYREKGEVTKQEEEHFCEITNHFNLSHTELYNQSFYQEFVKLLVLNDLLKGERQTRISISNESILINPQPDEQILWAFENSSLYELKKKTTYIGESAGYSGRILKGIYYRRSSFQGRTIETQNMEKVASGIVYLTDKNIYFYSPLRGIKIPYNKIISYTPYEDGLGIQKDGTNSKPICLKDIDGWFAYNFVKNIGNIN